MTMDQKIAVLARAIIELAHNTNRVFADDDGVTQLGDCEWHYLNERLAAQLEEIACAAGPHVEKT